MKVEIMLRLLLTIETATVLITHGFGFALHITRSFCFETQTQDFTTQGYITLQVQKIYSSIRIRNHNKVTVS